MRALEVVIFFNIEGILVQAVAASNPTSLLGYTVNYNAIYLFNHISPSVADADILQDAVTNPTQAALVLGLYCVFFILASFLIFRRQSLTVR